MQISLEENSWKKHLSKFAFNNYRYTRGYLRYFLSQVYKMHPLEVPLKADPGKPPFLDTLNGFISLSHTDEKLFLACAPNNIGIDIENKNRKFNANSLVKRFFKEDEKKELSKYKYPEISKEVLKYWIIKESAYKWQSIKSYSDFIQWEWVKNTGFAINKKKGLKVKTYFKCDQNYYFGIAYNLSN